MATLWERMTELYGHKWTSSYGVKDENGTWGKVLSGLSGPDIAKGLNACISSSDPWPPSAPEFRAMCLPTLADHGLLDADAAYRLACDHYGRKGDNSRQPLHPTIKKATRDAGGSQQLISSEQKHIFPAFKKAYQEACDLFIAGVGLEPKGLALPNQVRKQTAAEEHAAKNYAHLDDKQAGAKAHNDLKTMMGIKS